MTIKDQMQTIQGVLNTWATKYGGECHIAGDLGVLWYRLYRGPAKLIALVLYEGETPREHFEGGSITGRVDRRFCVLITRRRGMNLERSDNLDVGSGGQGPLFNLTEEAREMCRALIFDAATCERPIDYHGIELFKSPQGELMDGYEIRFSVGSQLPTVTDTPQNLQPPE